MRWYYTPRLGVDLSSGFDNFIKHDDSVADHLDSLLKTIMDHEQKTGQKIDADVVTWRGCMTKVKALEVRLVLVDARSLLCDRSWQPLLRTEMGALSHIS